MKKIELTKEWAGRKAGTVLAVLQPGEDLAAGAVDPARAAALIESGHAVAMPEPQSEANATADETAAPVDETATPSDETAPAEPPQAPSGPARRRGNRPAERG